MNSELRALSTNLIRVGQCLYRIDAIPLAWRRGLFGKSTEIGRRLFQKTSGLAAVSRTGCMSDSFDRLLTCSHIALTS